MSAEADFRQPNRIDLRSRCIETAPGFACLYGDHYPTLVAVLGDGWQLSDPVLGDPNVEIAATASAASASVSGGPLVGATISASATAATASVSGGPVIGATITAAASAATASVSGGPVIGMSASATAPAAAAALSVGSIVSATISATAPSATAALDVSAPAAATITATASAATAALDAGPVAGVTVGAAAAPATAELDVTALGSYPTPRASRLDVLAFPLLSVALTSRKLAPYPSRVESVSVPRWTRRRPLQYVPVYTITNRPLRSLKI